MRLFLALAIALTACGHARAQSVGRPEIAPGDSWTHRYTSTVKGRWSQHDVQLTAVHVDPDVIALDVGAPNSPVPPKQQLMGPDWSRERSVDGQIIATNRPFDFPLHPGGRWTVEFTEHNPNRQHSMEHYRFPYRVVGWQNVTVPAGTFRALEVEADGQWTATLAPGVSSIVASHADPSGAGGVTETTRTTARTFQGRNYVTYWYAPTVKRWVKSEEDFYSSNEELSSSLLAELVSFKAAS